MPHRLTIALLCMTLCASARAASDDPGPAPDPSKGERVDGRVVDARTQWNAGLLLPRLLLTPPRVLIEALSEPLHALIALEEKYRVLGILKQLTTYDDGARGLRPVFRYISRFEPQLGLTYFDHKLLKPGSSFQLTFGAVLPRLLFAEAQLKPYLPGPLKMTIDLGYLNRDDMLFAGVGPSSDRLLRSNQNPLARVAMKQVDAVVGLDIKLHRLLKLHVGEAWGLRIYGNGRFDDNVADDAGPIAQVYCRASIQPHCMQSGVDAKQVPGYYDGADFFATDARLSFDTRSDTYSPRRWVHADLGFRFAQTPSSEGPSWIRGRAAIAAGLPVDHHGRSLVLRLVAELLQPIQGTTPFSELVTLGGPDDLRGSPVQRFRDFSSLVATLEYRWPVWMWMDAALFTDWGGTFGRHFEAFSFAHVIPDFGAGLEFHTASHFVMRAQLAYGVGEGFQLLFSTTTGL